MARTLKVVEQPRGGGGGAGKTRRQRFEEIGEKRIGDIITAFAAAEKLGNPTHYEYTPEEADEIINTINTALEGFKYAIKHPGKRRRVLKFLDDE